MKRALFGISVSLNLLGLLAVSHLLFGDLIREWLNPRDPRVAGGFFDAYPIAAGDIVFLGDSITEGGRWNEMFPDHAVRNRGIGGDRTNEILARLDHILVGPPSMIFINIGTNDLSENVGVDTILENYRLILDRTMAALPDTKVYVQSLFPRAASDRNRVEALNAGIRSISEERGMIYLDLYPNFLGEDGAIKDALTYDGLHLSGAGYQEWQRLLSPYVAGE